MPKSLIISVKNISKEYRFSVKDTFLKKKPPIVAFKEKQ